MFIDGNLVYQNSARGVYQGRGTIYASGKITFNNSNDFCGSTNCDDYWDPTTNLVALVSGSSTDADGIEMVNSTRFQGALYVVNDIRERNSAVVWGPMIGRQIYLMNSVENHYVPIGTLLSGMPATYTEAVVISNEDGSWTA